ncbi:hypothetical protein NADFUDRAFT_80222 [Nadsonia fulvescens var. elongata DSM 6958]|uniref:DNA mismatch repair protein HSM3 n=1 Tax=Nadsonia fulvescens var. elongata DSM 6958 TaxID=857566 RepID=A0A1E3PFK3_9ASCO|nr:hypothetical protein NADFUDRAFT_80222 [Nadsonia fulvescens var. elongata DSM 6958]
MDISDALVQQVISLLTTSVPIDPTPISLLADQLAISQPHPSLPQDLLPLVVPALKNGNNPPTVLYCISELLSVLLDNSKWYYLQDTVNLADFEAALTCGIPKLQASAARAIGLASEANVLKGQNGLIKLLVKQLLELDYEIIVVSAITDSLTCHLANKPGVLRAFLSDDSILTILGQLHNGSAILQSRLMAIIEKIIIYINEPISSKVVDLFNYSPMALSDNDDILHTVVLVQHYNRLLVHTKQPKAMIDHLQAQIVPMAKLWSDIVRFQPLTDLFKAEVVEFISILSHRLPEVWKDSLAIQFNIPECLVDIKTPAEVRVLILSHIEPIYLAEQLGPSGHLSKITVKASNIGVFMNLVQTQQSFEFMTQLTSTSLLDLSYTDLFALLVQITRFEWSTQQLASHWPRVMSRIIEWDDITEPQSFNLRQQVLEQLFLMSNSDFLEHWKYQIKTAYKELIHGKVSAPIPVVGDSYA